MAELGNWRDGDPAGTLKAVRALAVAPDAAALARTLAREARAVAGPGTWAAYFRWEEPGGSLSAEWVDPPTDEPVRVASGGGNVVVQAAVMRRAVVDASHDLRSELVGLPAVRSVVALPVVGRERLFGVVVVGATEDGERFGAGVMQALGIATEAAGGILGSLEQARLDGAVLAARTAEHEVGNRLSLTVGWVELIESDPALPAHLRPALEAASRGARDAAELVQALCQAVRVRERAWGGDAETTMDVAASRGQE